jgi:hypothetical protein
MKRVLRYSLFVVAVSTRDGADTAGDQLPFRAAIGVAATATTNRE